MPSSHSGSSHSSSSGGFSSHSSGGGFSSHSSSSHSSSWSSSGSSWGSSGGSLWGSSRSSPSRHSSSSSSGKVYRSQYVRDGSMRGTVNDRTRYNQPRGYVAGEHHNVDPIPHYCVHHNYYYYPFSWTDRSTGQEYKKGYYDENGKYYENVVFRSEGKYKNVICQCEYCDTITKIDWTEGGPLICPQCGGTMKILSALDEYTRDPQYEKVSRNANYVDYADRSSYSGSSDDSAGKATGLIGFLAALFAIIIVIAGLTAESRSNSDPYENDHPEGAGWVYLGNGAWARYGTWNEEAGRWDPVGYDDEDGGGSVYNPDLFNEIIYLNDTEPGVCVITGDYYHDRELVWDEEQQSYYDADSGLWAWYNTEVRPPLWQYWYEPISQDYGDYGWMEYEDGVWYIEANADEWIPVPEQYDVSPLWHIESSPVPEGDDTPSDLEIFGEVIYLAEDEDGVCRITDEADCSRILWWQDAEQSYYDEAGGIWVWYNTEVDPPLWQYWYEPISGDFGDYGWMEYEDGTWYIEEDAGVWFPLPEEYDTSPLWHFDPEPVG